MPSSRSDNEQWQQDFVLVDRLDTWVRQGTQNTQIQPSISVDDLNFEWEGIPDRNDNDEDLPGLPIERYNSVWEAMLFQL